MPFASNPIRKRAFIPVKNENGEPTAKRFPIQIAINAISFDCYGERIEFRKNARGIGYSDSRNPRKPLCEADCRAEILRMLGSAEGTAAWEALNAF